ncbi:xanthine dehydrogenase accessory factor [Kineosphaera limosa]|uniref:Xanthine dehydrogenase accessory protein n=1 Tax=Kineosphaera limosa NBRC 100340 TaxID=1184609 RepID=K6WUV2_9MICO|nr:xanthine dehydrogenase accessory protein XdhC [Kineosphaera limosa]NYD99501.1 xanthine dehydrogenase accessory factor [Kineosphaera limosa]GAB97631.1 xanthine dehydrogenase accessory protein [Kineosphaera limosa NBRC 100340]
MHWLEAVARLRERREPGVLVTVTSVHGHAPRAAGAKMVVAAPGGQLVTWGSIGGGNLEATALDRARELLAALGAGAGGLEPQTFEAGLTDKASNRHGRQCCGGQVQVLLEPLPVVPAVAIFGLGHVGLELARILARHDLELHLVDSRSDAVEPQRLAALADADARVHTHHAPVPELVLGQVPPGTHALIMTHDHAEDLALCDAALRTGHLGSVGVIGSSAKWSRFRRTLAEEGHEASRIDGIRCPIGLPGVPGKEPAAIAVAVAAELLRQFAGELPATAMATEGNEGVRS